MQQQTVGTGAKSKAFVMRPNGEPICISDLRDSVSELVRMCEQAQAHADAFSSLVKGVAEKSGIRASVITKYIKAVAGEKYEAEKAKVEQLALVFEEAGDA